MSLTDCGAAGQRHQRAAWSRHTQPQQTVQQEVMDRAGGVRTDWSDSLLTSCHLSRSQALQHWWGTLGCSAELHSKTQQVKPTFMPGYPRRSVSVMVTT